MMKIVTLVVFAVIANQVFSKSLNTSVDCDGYFSDVIQGKLFS